MQSDVRDTEVLTRLNAGLGKLSGGFDNAAQDLRGCILRTEDWIRHEMPAYWKRQTQLAERELNSALDHLQQKQSSTRPGDRPAATEAKKRVDRAKSRVDVCREKTQACRRHLHQLEAVINHLAGPLADLTEIVDVGLPNAANDLAAIVEILDAYRRGTIGGGASAATPAHRPSGSQPQDLPDGGTP